MFFVKATGTTVIYTLSLHDALPILPVRPTARDGNEVAPSHAARRPSAVSSAEYTAPTSCASSPSDDSSIAGRFGTIDRKSTRLNSSHSQISYAVFCLKKKKIVTMK